MLNNINILHQPHKMLSFLIYLIKSMFNYLPSLAIIIFFSNKALFNLCLKIYLFQWKRLNDFTVGFSLWIDGKYCCNISICSTIYYYSTSELLYEIFSFHCTKTQRWDIVNYKYIYQYQIHQFYRSNDENRSCYFSLCNMTVLNTSNVFTLILIFFSWHTIHSKYFYW
jgi:hypothetical protein